MNCVWTQGRLSAYVDGELSGRECLVLRRHMQTCPMCAREAQELRAVKAMLAMLAEPEPPTGFEERLYVAVFEGRAARSGSRVPFSWLVASAAAAAVVTFAALQLIGHGGPTSGTPQVTDIRRDQVFTAGIDPLGGSSPIVTVANGGR